MTDISQFEDIRPFDENEYPIAIQKFLEAAEIDTILNTIYPEVAPELLKAQIGTVQTVDQLHELVMKPIVKRMLASTTDNFTYSGVENLNPKETYLFISNHRDIVLDPALLDLVVIENGFKTVEIAIGDNLVRKDWIKNLVRLNRCFIVKRSQSPRELVQSSRVLSNYVKYALGEKKIPVWIAQREGRAKDGNDRTQAGLINMLGMAAQGSLLEHFKQLNIVPVSMSYEKDPCDIDKVKALEAASRGEKYIKSVEEDEISMRNGILGHKGNIHFHFGQPINSNLSEVREEIHKNELINILCSLIDEQVLGNYKLWKSNYLAYDLLHESTDYKALYSKADVEQYIGEKTKKLELAGINDPSYLKFFYQIDARPLINKLQLEATVDK